MRGNSLPGPAGGAGRWLAVLAAAAAGMAAAGCRREAAGQEEPAAGPKRVHCAPAEARSVEDVVLLHGTVAPLPDRDSQIAPQVTGRILRVLVREGDRVQSGQPLAHIDDAPLADQAAQAAAVLAKARAEANLAAVSRDRVQRVFERGIAARQELDDAEARVASARASEAEARAAAEIANRQVARAVVRSPLAGVVLKLFRKPGELVDGSPATPILEVGDPSRLELVAAAAAADLVQVPLGATAAIDIPALAGRTFPGKVTAVSPAIDRTSGLGVVRVGLDLSGGVHPPVGVAGNVRVAVGTPRPAVVVPAAALRASAGAQEEIVVCGADGHAHVTPVRRGLTVDRMVEVRATGAVPLAAGAAVAVDPVLGLADGDALEIVP
jgi:RND family efflux transporter MFP subunit